MLDRKHIYESAINILYNLTNSDSFYLLIDIAYLLMILLGLGLGFFLIKETMERQEEIIMTKNTTSNEKNLNKKTILVSLMTVFCLALCGYGIFNLIQHQKIIGSAEELQTKIPKSKDIYQQYAESLKNSANQSIKGGLSAKSDWDGVHYPTAKEMSDAKSKSNQAKAMKSTVGTIQIPSLNLKLRILQGTNQRTLAYGATTMNPHQKMGEGNYVLAGHNMQQKGVLFSDLITNDKPQVHKGDTIKLSNGKETFTYEITSTETVKNTDTSILDQTEEPTLTLFTCTKAKSISDPTPWRFVVHAKLVNTSTSN